MSKKIVLKNMASSMTALPDPSSLEVWHHDILGATRSGRDWKYIVREGVLIYRHFGQEKTDSWSEKYWYSITSPDDVKKQMESNEFDLKVERLLDGES